ncbi:MAG TPA: TetR/AcrR family transcriptional regulator [Thermomicrobiales bacterium]|nr:TetR/AcrR family transcriptional regulator [Thermomicrobiales bacterium]
MTEKSSTRETILAGALDLFADRGYSGVGVEELAASAGVTKPTLYHYFGNKQGVFEALVAERYDPFLDELAIAAGYQGDLPLTLTRVVHAFFGFGTREEKIFRMGLAAELTARDNISAQIMAPRLERQHAMLTELFVQAARDHGNMRGKHRLAAATLNATIVAYLRLAADGDLVLDDAAVWQLIQQFSYGIYS